MPSSGRSTCDLPSRSTASTTARRSPPGARTTATCSQAVIKDIVPRYWTMRGHRVVRRFGWDTHGLPVEMEVESPRALRSQGHRRVRDRALQRGLPEGGPGEHRELGVAHPPTRSLGRLRGRLQDHGPRVHGERVVGFPPTLGPRAGVPATSRCCPTRGVRRRRYPTSRRTSTTARSTTRRSRCGSRWWAAHGPVAEGDWLLIWTTTPWTLPGNLAVAVGRGHRVRLRRVPMARGIGSPRAGSTGRLGRSRDRRSVSSSTPGAPTCWDRVPAAVRLVRRGARPGRLRVIPATEVTTDEGTGLVHMAPAYGEADFAALQAAGLDVLVDPVDAEGRFTDAMPDRRRDPGQGRRPRARSRG